MMAKGIGTYLGKAFTLALFMVISVLTLFFAYGYQYDFKKQDIRKTSIIDINADEEGVRVLLEGKQVSTVLPYQITGVLPGKYVVEVMKDGFNLWQRQIDVVEDIVTIVNDVIMVPVDTEKYIKPLFALEEPESRYRYGRDFIVEILPEDKGLRVVTFYGNGTVKDEDIELFKSGIRDIRTFEDGNFLIFFDDGGSAWVSYEKKDFAFFGLPEGAEGVSVNAGRGYLYFLLNGGFYAIPVNDADDLEESADDFKVADEVNAYVYAINDDIYFLKDGVVFKSDHMGRGPEPVTAVDGKYINIGFKSGRAYGALILRDKDQKRFLFVTDKDGNLLSLENDLKGDVFFDASDRLLFAGHSGSIFVFDPAVGMKTEVSRQSEEFELLGWFSDDGHFLQKDGDSVILKDIHDSNRYTLMDGIDEVSAFFPLDRTLFFIKGGSLHVLDWVS